MVCGESGETRMMTTTIPFFREIIVCSFECTTCGEKNNEVIFGGALQERGIRYVLEVNITD
jgi:zinc finger protein